jgi:RNA polymerase sigma-70 factor, ECF subfamily
MAERKSIATTREKPGSEAIHPDDDAPRELIQQIQAGIRREENFEKLFRRSRPFVQSFFLRKGFSSEESRDLTQDVFLRVVKGIDTFRRESRFERWLWEIAAHI